MSEELQFLVMANCHLDLPDFMKSLGSGLKIELKEEELFRFRSFYYARNWVQVDYNEDYDEELMKTDEDAFLYYKYRIEVSPTEDVTLEEQIHLTKIFTQVISNIGGEVVIGADFEELL